MKKLLALMMLACVLNVSAQVSETVVIDSATADSAKFCCTVSNNEHKVYIVMNLRDGGIVVPGQEIMGEMDGYIGHETDYRKWFITSSRMLDEKTAELQIINDYGSEDLVATLKLNDDGSYTMTQQEGSTIKFAVKNKWAKLPKKLDFKVKTN